MREWLCSMLFFKTTRRGGNGDGPGVAKALFPAAGRVTCRIVGTPWPEYTCEKLGSNVAEVKPDNLTGAAARWLRLSLRTRVRAGR